MRAGPLDRKIHLLTAGIVTDGYGDQVEGFTEMGPFAASVRPAPGTERLANAETAASAPTIFRIRWSSAVSGTSARDRVRYGGIEYDIKSVNEIGRREGLEIAAVARIDR